MGTERSTLTFRSLRGSMVKGRKGFSMAELLVSVAILVFLMTVIFGLLAAAQSAFNNADAGIQLRTVFRNAGQKMSWELARSGYDASAAAQFTISAGAGANGSDVIRFSVPVACDSTSSFLDSSGNPARWGAFLTWGCSTVACSDPDGSCATVEYKYIQYALNANGAIIRSVLSPSLGVVGTPVIIADNITDLHFSTTGGTSGLTFTITGQKKSASGMMVKDSTVQTVRFMN